MKIDRLKNLKKHLTAQLQTAKCMGSKWVYILTSEAEKCLELAEAEETIMMKPVPAELEGGGSTWWYVCGECHTAIDTKYKFCRECGRRISWNG